MVTAGVVGGLLVAALFLLGHYVAAQDFGVTYSVDRSAPNRARVRGEVVNNGRADALDVYVTGLRGDRLFLGRCVERQCRAAGSQEIGVLRHVASTGSGRKQASLDWLARPKQEIASRHAGSWSVTLDGLSVSSSGLLHVPHM